MQLHSILATRERAAGALIDRPRSAGYFEIRRMSGYGMAACGGYCCKSRKSNDSENLAKVDFLEFSTAATLFSVATQVRGRFLVNRCGPSRCRARNASAVLKIFTVQPEKTFATLSAQSGHCRL